MFTCIRPLPTLTQPSPSSPPSRHRGTAGFVFAWLALTLVGFAPRAWAAPTLVEQANPTDEEQYLLQKLNRARTDPAGEGQRLAAWLRNTVIGRQIVQQYSTNPDQVAAGFAALPAVPALACDASLLSAARRHSDDLAAHHGVPPNGDYHAGYDGSDGIGRDQSAGFNGSSVGEDVSYGYSDLDAINAGFLVDWGNPNLDHRDTRMNGAYRTNAVGIALAPYSGGLIETEDFGAPALVVVNHKLTTPNAPAFLTGVVYRDANGNGQYDTGEGVAGVTVTMDGGAYFALTSASGGYTLPLVNADGSPADGPVNVHAKFSDGATANRTVTVNSYGAPAGSYRGNVLWEVAGGANVLPAFFNGAASLAQGWSYLAFPNGKLFGYYNAGAFPYLFHDDLGWEYAQDAQDGQGGVYLYDFASGAWWYTSPSFGFPYLYDFTRRAVLYYYPDPTQPGRYASGPRWFFDFGSGQIITR